MGKGTDKLYITHSEWSSEDAFGASGGSKGAQGADGSASFKRLPFTHCALTLQPFQKPVCIRSGTIFDHEAILEWLKKHGTNPVDGEPLKSSELIQLHFTEHDGSFVDPVTFKAFADNTQLVTLKNTGNVFAYDTVQRLNVKAKNWVDLVSGDEFVRSDIITIQDPQNLAGRDLSSFEHLKQKKNSSSTSEGAASKDSDKISRAKELVSKARAERAKAAESSTGQDKANKFGLAASGTAVRQTSKVEARPYNAAAYTTGRAAASFTSTGLTPDTSGERAILTDEEYMLKPKRVKVKGYARLKTNYGELNIELYPEYAPKAVWNFVQLAKKDYYKNVPFHRNIRNFMIQGGDPTGTGRGGTSIWNRNFADEFEGPLTHNARGTISMANKGKNTNSSQFFILYREAKHLDRKHTIFGKVVGGLDTLTALENVQTGDKDRPLEDIILENVVVFVDPFEEFLKSRKSNEEADRHRAEVKKAGGAEDDQTTWTGKRVRTGGAAADSQSSSLVGKYLRNAAANPGSENGEQMMEDLDEPIAEPVKKKTRTGGFGNFDNW